jgi:hypothetical protein
MKQETLLIEFDGVSTAEASDYAIELRDALLDSSDQIEAKIMPGAKDTQDFGSTLVLVLGAPSVIIAAKALRDWLKFRYGASISIKTPDGSIVVKNITSKDAESLMEKLPKIM